jgi:hypothetical protein
MGIGALMLVPWIRRGGLHPPRAPRSRAGPAVALGHASAASAGLLAWIAYLVTGWTGLAWLAVGILLAVIGLGMATLTVWTAQGVRPGQPGPQDPVPPEEEASAPPRRPGSDMRIIIPIVHGLTASAAILLALLTALGAG